MGIRAWVATEDYWSVTWELREKIKTAFDRHHIEIPYNRLEVNLQTKKEQEDR
jgi:small conductance mechanosensitive channel